MKRLLWTTGLAIFGFYFGWNGQGADVDLRQVAIATVWAGCIGYGFGSIFEQRITGRRLMLYWAATLFLVGLFFGPLLPFPSFIVRQVLGGAIGALAGILIGTVQLKLARRKSTVGTDSGASP
jgi:drug/metabolite transporter (DMT)-like permease